MIEGMAIHAWSLTDEGALTRYANIRERALWLKEKPPWWDRRGAHLALLNPPSQGRSAKRNAAKARKARLVHDAALLVRDVKELIAYEEAHIRASMIALEDGPEHPKYSESVMRMRYLVWMYVETHKFAEEVRHAAAE